MLDNIRRVWPANVLVFLPSIRVMEAFGRAVDELKLEGCVVNIVSAQNFDREKERLAAGPTSGKWVIISTNVLESGITLPYLDVVVDSGYELTIKFNPYFFADVLNMFDITTKDRITQRTGRVGRTHKGVVVRCYPEAFYNKYVPNNQESQLTCSN